MFFLQTVEQSLQEPNLHLFRQVINKYNEISHYAMFQHPLIFHFKMYAAVPRLLKKYTTSQSAKLLFGHKFLTL